VVADSDTDGSNGILASAAGTMGVGNTATYTLNKVPAGPCFVYAVVYGETGNGSATSDYVGFYGGFPPSATGNVVVPTNGSLTGLDISLSPSSSSGGSTGSVAVTSTVPSPLSGTVTVSGTFSNVTPTSVLVVLGTQTYPATLGAGTWTAQVDSTKVMNGTTTLVVVAYNGSTAVATTNVIVTVANGSATAATVTLQAGSTDSSQNAALPLLRDFYAVGADGSRTLETTLQLDALDATASASVPPGTYVTLDYSDRDGNGAVSAGDWVGDAGLMTLAAGEIATEKTYFFPSNISAKRTLATLSDLDNLVYIEYHWTGSNAQPTDDTLTVVFTTNPGNVTDRTAWVYYPNGGSYSNGRGLVGIPSGTTYGIFLFRDANSNGVLDAGETYYWPSTTTFPSLDDTQTVIPSSLTTFLTEGSQGPMQLIKYSDADEHSYTTTTVSGTGTLGTITIN
jgi:hypothetical protein